MRPCLSRIALPGLIAAALFLPATAHARPGSLDSSFGDRGRVFADLPGTYLGSEFTSLARQPDGKLLVTGTLGTAGGETEGTVERRGPAGSLDPSFGEGGAVAAPNARGLALQDDGRILFGVDAGNSCQARAALHRLEPSGRPDLSFGKGGVSASFPLRVERIAIQPDGGIVVAGIALFGPCGHDLVPKPGLALARLLPGGSLDPSFGNAGVVLTQGEGLTETEVAGLALGEDGTAVVAAGSSLLRFSASGSLDTAFGANGVVEPIGKPKALLGLPGGELVLAGLSSHSCCEVPGDFVLTRYRADGSLNPGFGDGGIARLDVGEIDEASALALAADGDIVLAGQSTSVASCEASCRFNTVLTRFTPSGAPDLSAGTDNWVPVFTPSGPASTGGQGKIVAMATTPSGQILAAGGSGFRGDAFIVARGASGEADPSFGSIGSVQQVVQAPSTSEATGVAIEPNGHVIVTAQSNARVRSMRPVLFNFKPSGRPDRAVGFGGVIATDVTGPLRAAGRNGLFAIAARDSGDYVVRFGNRGRLDMTYGSRGGARLPSGFSAGSFLPRPDGSVLVLGRIRHHWGMAVYRLAPNGHPDARFGHRGLTVVGFGHQVNAEARSALVQRDGRIVVLGWQRATAAMARLLPDGHLDRGFGRRGRMTNFIGHGTQAFAAVPRPGGLLLACVRAPASTPGGTVLVALTATGRRDPSFAHRGAVRPPGTAAPLALLADKRHAVLVVARPGRRKGGVVLRAFDATGSPDRRFGRRGVLAAAVGQSRPFVPVAVARRDGEIVVAGTAGPDNPGSRVELLGVKD
jgi:uncharacterized delta-60 repeat protein